MYAVSLFHVLPTIAQCHIKITRSPYSLQLGPRAFMYKLLEALIAYN